MTLHLFELAISKGPRNFQALLQSPIWTYCTTYYHLDCWTRGSPFGSPIWLEPQIFSLHPIFTLMKLLITYTKETLVDRLKNDLLKIPQKWTKAMIPASPSSFLVFKKFFNFNTYFLHPLFVLCLVYIPFLH